MKQHSQQSLSKKTCEWLIANNYNPEDLNQPGENGDTALMKATREGNYSVIQELTLFCHSPKTFAIIEFYSFCIASDCTIIS